MSSDRPELVTRARWWWQVAATGVVVALVDWLSKALAVGMGPCCGTLLQPLPNREYMLGVGSGGSIGLGIVSLVALIPAVLYASSARARIPGWVAGLVVGGGAANAAERLAIGHVTDFIQLGQVVINLADVALVVGLLVVTWRLLRTDHDQFPRAGTDQRPVATRRRAH